MKNLLIKEFRLSMHPTSLIFLCLSAMLLIPNYPYGVTFFYTGLAVFFTCLSGRENHDIFYTMTLPVKKTDIVKARFAHVVILQLLQLIIAVPFAAIRNGFDMPGNQVGMDANIAMFGIVFVMLGLFNITFLTAYYKDVEKVGRAFVVSTAVIFGYMAVAEAMTHVFPFFRDVLDTKDPENLGSKVVVLAAGMILYAVLTFLAYKKSAKTFEAEDL